MRRAFLIAPAHPDAPAGHGPGWIVGPLDGDPGELEACAAFASAKLDRVAVFPPRERLRVLELADAGELAPWIEAGARVWAWEDFVLEFVEWADLSDAEREQIRRDNGGRGWQLGGVS